MFKKKFSIQLAHVRSVVFMIVAYLSPTVLLAACNSSTQFCNPFNKGTIQELLLAIINIIIYIMSPVIVLMVIYTGFLFVKAQGNAAKLTEARKALLGVLVGAAIVLGAFGIAEAIKSTMQSVTGLQL